MCRSQFLAAMLLLLLAMPAPSAVQADERGKSGEVAQAGKPAATYPRLSRRWTSKSGQHHFDAELTSFPGDGASVELRAADGRVANVPLESLDDDSRQIAADAANYFALEQEMQTLLKACDAGLDPHGDEFAQLVAAANQRVSRRTPKLRYRVVSVSEMLPPQKTRSRTGEYRLSLSPLFEFQTADALQGKPLAAEYLDHWHLTAEEFRPEQIAPQQTILEVPGRPQFNPATDTAEAHFQLTAEGSDAPCVQLRIHAGNPRLYTPGAGGATNPLETMFPAPASAQLAAAPRGGTPPVTRPTRPTTTRPTIPRPGGTQGVNSREDPASKIARMREEAKRSAAEAVQQAAEKGASSVGGAVGTDKLVNVSGSNQTLTVAAAGRVVRVTGIGHVVTVTGKCKEVAVAGTGHHIMVEEVGLINVTGVNNRIEYVRGPAGRAPEVKDFSKLNNVGRIASLPK